MSTSTTNYQLIKPELTDSADITAMNVNWDKIDEELKNNKTYTDEKFKNIPAPDVSGQIKTHNEDTSAHEDIRKIASDHIENKNNPHNVTTEQIGAIPTSQKGIAGGVATLGSDKKVPAEQLPEISTTKYNSAILYTNSWHEGSDGRFYQTVNVSNVATDTKVVVVDVDLSTTDIDAKVEYLEAWGHPSANEVKQGNGTLTFYAWEKPTANIPIHVGVM